MNAEAIKKFAASLGFSLAGIATIQRTRESDFYAEWLDRGYAGEMQYLERQRAARLDPQSVLPGARSVIVCAINYNTAHPKTIFEKSRAWISRYAWGRDYHNTLQEKLRALARWIESNSPSNTKTYVDTGPLTERVFARYAGIGWFGKNTCIINQQTGSWLFLGCVLTDLELETDVPPPDRCGTCTRCLDACPTNAFVAPYVLDSRKCISYTTIELRGAIPETEREGIGHHLFGCDICQDVCPWNRKAATSGDAEFQPRELLMGPEIATLLDLSAEDWLTAIRGTPLKRAKLKGLFRNLMVVAGNSGIAAYVPRLRRYLDHEDEHVRSHALWAIRKLDNAPSSVPPETGV
jgi:epoxyqueuosine reductase